MNLSKCCDFKIGFFVVQKKKKKKSETLDSVLSVSGP